MGRDAKPAFQYKIEDILSKQELHGEPVQVKTFRSIAKEAMRAVVWAPDCGLVLFPPFYSYPDFSPEAARDLRNFVRGGSNVSGTVLFVGGGLEISVMNKLFDFNVHSEYVSVAVARARVRVDSPPHRPSRTHPFFCHLERGGCPRRRPRRRPRAASERSARKRATRARAPPV